MSITRGEIMDIYSVLCGSGGSVEVFERSGHSGSFLLLSNATGGGPIKLLSCVVGNVGSSVFGVRD